MAKQIQCCEFENRIQDLMDQRIELNSDLTLTAHAERCDECCALLKSFSSLESVLLEAFNPDQVICNDDQQNSIQDKIDKTTSRLNWAIGFTALAASVCFLLIAPIFLDQNTPVEIAQRDHIVVDTPTETTKKVTDEAYDADFESALSLLPIDANSLSLDVYESLPYTLQNAYQYAAELPVVRPLERSVNATIEMIQKSLDSSPDQKQETDTPDLGRLPWIAQNRMV